MAIASTGQGLHTLRLVEADIRGQLSEHKAGLQAQLLDSTRQSEESAFTRAEALTLQHAAALRGRVEEVNLVAIDRAEAAAVDSRRGDEAVRLELVDVSRSLRGEIFDVRAKLPGLHQEIRDIFAATQGLRDAHSELRQLLEGMREEFHQKLDEKDGAVHNELLNVTRDIIKDVEDKFRRLQARADHAEAALNLGVGEARREALVATDTAALVERHLVAKIEDSRVFATEEAGRCANETANIIREESQELAEKFRRRVLDYEVTVDRRVAAFDTVLRGILDKSITECLDNANRHSENAVNALATHIDELVQATRADLEAQGKTHTECAAKWREQLSELKKNFDAANVLAQRSIEQLQDCTAHLGRDSAELREDLRQTQHKFANCLKAVDMQLQEKASKAEALESSKTAHAAAVQTHDKLEKFAAVLDGQRRWLDDRIHHVSTRCHGAEVEAFDAKARAGVAARWGPPFTLSSKPSHHTSMFASDSTMSAKGGNGGSGLTDTLPSVVPTIPTSPPHHPLTPRMAARRHQQEMQH